MLLATLVMVVCGTFLLWDFHQAKGQASPQPIGAAKLK
jgi:uncharacterized iron-regulated membrane protein